MPSMSIWDSVRDLVRHQDLGAAIELVEGWLKGRLDSPKHDIVRDWLDELLLHFASARSVQLDARKGLITAEEEGVKFRQIAVRILALVHDVEREDLSVSNVAPVAADIPRQYEDGQFEKIIGNRRHLQMISWLEKGLKCSTGVCRLVSGQHMGTGFRAGRDLIVTNNHVIAGIDAARGYIAQFFFEERIDHTMKDVMSIQLNTGRFWTSERLDVTIVGADFDTSSNEEMAVLDLQSANVVAVGDSVSIIQHPLGGPKQIALTANEVINLYDHRIQYITDTLPGSSGAPVFDATWNVVAVHHAGGNVLRNAKGDTVFANEGISVAVAIPEAYQLITRS